MRVVGIAGTDGSGKSSLAEAVMSSVGDRLVGVRAPFAEQLRHEIKELLDRDLRNNHRIPDGWMVDFSPADPWEKPTPSWMRSLLRGWGDYKRSINPDYWVESWRGLVQFLDARKTPRELLIIADDIRYVNELEAIHNLGGVVLYLDDAAVPDHQLLHELLDVREMADIGFTVDSRAGKWADPEAVVEALGL